MKNVTALAKTLLALGALFVFAAPILAQTPAAPPMKRQRRPMSNLNLTPAQKTKMQAIMKDARAKREALRGNTTLAPAQKRAQMQAIAKDSMAKASAILTPAQLAKLKANRAANGPRNLQR